MTTAENEYHLVPLREFSLSWGVVLNALNNHLFYLRVKYKTGSIQYTREVYFFNNRTRVMFVCW